MGNSTKESYHLYDIGLWCTIEAKHLSYSFAILVLFRGKFGYSNSFYLSFYDVPAGHLFRQVARVSPILSMFKRGSVTT